MFLRTVFVVEDSGSGELDDERDDIAHEKEHGEETRGDAKNAVGGKECEDEAAQSHVVKGDNPYRGNDEE